LSQGIPPTRELSRALILLDSTDFTLDNVTIAQRQSVSRATVETVHHRYRRGGLDRALHEAPRSGQPKQITPREDACITAIACTEPPAGQVR